MWLSSLICKRRNFSKVKDFIVSPHQIPSSGCAVVDLQGDALRVEMLLGKMSYLLYWRESFTSSHTDMS